MTAQYTPGPPNGIHPKTGDKVMWKNNAGRTIYGFVIGMYIGSPGGFAPHDTYAEIRPLLKSRDFKRVPWRRLQFAPSA